MWYALSITGPCCWTPTGPSPCATNGRQRTGSGVRLSCRLGRYAEAAEAFGGAIELDAEYAGWWLNRVLVKCDCGCFREAPADASEAMRLDAGLINGQVRDVIDDEGTRCVGGSGTLRCWTPWLSRT